VLRKQILILLGMLAALAVCLAVALRALGSHDPATVAVADRLALAVHWLLVPGLCLFVGVAFTAHRRFFSATEIDGERRPPPGSFEINLRYNLNTLEQVVLAAVVWTGLALELPAQDLNLIPALAGLFALGRAAFWLGYLFAPWARAFGFAVTFYPIIASMVWLTFRAFA